VHIAARPPNDTVAGLERVVDGGHESHGADEREGADIRSGECFVHTQRGGEDRATSRDHIVDEDDSIANRGWWSVNSNREGVIVLPDGWAVCIEGGG
jgi:hypothetical protein